MDSKEGFLSPGMMRLAQRTIQFGCWQRDFPDGRVLACPTAGRILGIEGESEDAGDFLERVHPEDRHGLQDSLRGRGSPGYSVEYRIRMPGGGYRNVQEDGEIEYAALDVPRRITGIVRDVSGRRLAEERFRQATKLEATGLLTAGVIHDLNNVFAILQGNLELLSSSAPGNPKLMRLADRSMRALTRATKLAKRMMDFVRATPDARPAIIDVGECLGDFEVLLRKVVPVTTRVEMNVRATARVEACRLQLETAILNLVVNARDASPIDGVIRVDVDVVETHGASGGGTYVLVSVEDEGAGVPPEVMGRLFEPFFTTKPPGKGTGLGLSNVRSFVDSAGGFMRIQSEVGQGTKVQLYLPVAQGGVQGLELKPGLCG